MSEVFLKIVNMSISAGWIVLAVLVLRLLLKKAPKWITVLLWGVVAIRLICPFSIESVISLIPNPETIHPEIMMDHTPAIDSGIPLINTVVNPIIEYSFTPDPGTSANPLQLWIPTMATFWMIGMAIMLGYTVISYWRIKRKIGTAVLLRNNIFQSEKIISPFVLGVIKPKIYLPFSINEQDMAHVIAHENAHIQRKDHLWKPFGFLVLTLHWFNPLMWLGYVLLCRDIELACDEKVIKEWNTEQKADYSQALLTCSINRRAIAACPLAFGEVGIKDRVKSVLNYKKPAFWLVMTALIACMVVAICFLTNPFDATASLDDDLKVYVDCQIAGRFQTEESEGRACCLDWEVIGKKKQGSTTTLYMWVMYQEYSYNGSELKIETGAHIPTVITVKKKDGHYALIEYWQAKDGSYHVPSIKEKFPWYLHSKALDSQRYVEKQQSLCRKTAEEYFANSNVSWEQSQNETAIEAAFMNHLEQELKKPDTQIGTYTLCDLNKDEKPELLYWEESHLTVCVYYNGTVVKLETAGFNSMNGPIKILENGAMLSAHVSTGTIYCYETLGANNTVSTLYFISSDYGAPLYVFDNKTVSKDEWDRLTKAYFEIPEAKIEWKTFEK